MTSWSQFTEELKGLFGLLENSMRGNSDKILAQQKLYTDLYFIFSKHSKKLATLANGLNEQVLAAAHAEESNLQHHQLLSNSLLRIADASRRVSLRLKSEILDPLKTFSENYGNVSDDMQGRFRVRLQSLNAIEAEIIKNKETYMVASQKFEKHREMQKKVIEKIESGSKSELQKFNLATKKFTENISSAEKFYLASVEKANHGLSEAKKELTEIGQSLAYNEDSRRSFFRKTIINSIRTLQEFSSAYDPEPARKLQEHKGEIRLGEESALGDIRGQLQRALSLDYREEFVSYQEMMRNKKKKLEDEDFGHLQDYFSKLSQQDRKSISQLVNSWLVARPAKKMSEQLQGQPEGQPLSINSSFKESAESGSNRENSKNKQRKGSLSTQEESLGSATKDLVGEQWDLIRHNVLSELPHSLFFVERLYRGVQEMSSFYLRAPEEGFIFLLNAFSTISNHLDFKEHLGVEFMYKIMLISTRIMLRRASTQPPQLLCAVFGKSSSLFKQSSLLPSLLSYLHRRRAQRKKLEEKGALQRAKGILAAFSRSKAPVLNEEEQYNCLQELVGLVTHFSVPNEIVLPFLRESLGRSHQDAYDYLKGLILNKKDAEERQNIQVRRQIQQKKEQLLRSALQRKTLAIHAMQLVAERGFLGLKDLNCRLVCRQLQGIHKWVLAGLDLPPDQKWVRLVPLNRGLDYIAMKHEVAQESVPSGVEQIITLDVNRSLHLHGQSLSPTVLHSLLRTYAHFHKDIGYCQGMNYLAGYLYIKLGNEEDCYRVFEHLMEIRFKEIFANQFQALKIKMYQFDRLLVLFHPEISEHFKRHSISPECYIVSWIITLFASSYQYTLKSYLIDQIWERFIIWGWPEFFRSLLWLFSLHKQELLELSYDRALHFLGELPRSSLFLSDRSALKQLFPDLQEVREGVEGFPVSQELLDKFTNEYNLDQKDE